MRGQHPTLIPGFAAAPPLFFSLAGIRGDQIMSSNHKQDKSYFRASLSRRERALLLQLFEATAIDKQPPQCVDLDACAILADYCADIGADRFADLVRSYIASKRLTERLLKGENHVIDP
jgi:hypothetical protein